MISASTLVVDGINVQIILYVLIFVSTTVFSTNPLVTFPSMAGFWLCFLVQSPILNERPTQKKFEAIVD